VRRPPAAGALLAAAATAGFIALPIPVARDGGGREPGIARWLPLEVHRLHEDPSYTQVVRGDAMWLVPRASAFPEERNPGGVWLRGATWSDWVRIAPAPTERLRFTVSALAEHRLVASTGDRTVTVVFDSATKRAGTPVELPVRASARSGGFFFPAQRSYATRIRFETDGGAVPRQTERRSPDTRYLGAFVGLPD
jgi:hypothetical protein